jgi:hypothetical protein
MNAPVLFQSLSHKEKVEFFVHCQELLVKFHPKSHFVFTKENLAERTHWVESFLSKYKGYTYSDENICVLFNKVRVDDARNPNKVLKDHVYREPASDFNAVSIDFVVFRKLGDCLAFCKDQYSPQIEWIVFVKNNEIKLYKTKDLLVHLNAPLSVFL